jgi:mannose-6-phosphate isomerase-like protein (cupin superfamily)
MSEFRYTSAEAAKSAAANEVEPYAVMLRRGTLELGFYAPSDVDLQQPHEQDEVYLILNGTGKFSNDGVVTDFGPGDALFVPAGVDHRFVEFTEDTEMWVVFYGPSGGEVRDI